MMIIKCYFQGKKILGRPRRRWKDNIKMDLGEVEMEGVN
jgi:hypothetical protein